MGPFIIIVVLAPFAFTNMLPATWVLPIALGALSLHLIVGNPVAGFMARRRKKDYSWVPFLGGVFGASSLLFCPIHGVRYFACIPLILDFTFAMFLYAVFVMGAFRSK